MKLNQLKIGQSAVITAVGGEGALRNRLIDMGLIPKTRLTLRKVAPMGDPVEIRIRGYELTIRLEDAEIISVEPTDDEPAVQKSDVADKESENNKENNTNNTKKRFCLFGKKKEKKEN